MKVLDYILKINFLLALSIGCIFLIGPGIFNMAFEKRDQGLPSYKIEKFEVGYLNAASYKYLRLVTVINKSEESKVFRIDEHKHYALFDFLRSKRLLNIKGYEYTKPAFQNVFPINVSSEKLDTWEQGSYTLNSKNELELLKIGDEWVIGSETGGFVKVIGVLLGCIIILLGAIVLVFGSLSIIYNIREYRKTGELPQLPNTAKELWNGIKFWVPRSNK